MQNRNPRFFVDHIDRGKHIKNAKANKKEDAAFKKQMQVTAVNH